MLSGRVTGLVAFQFYGCGEVTIEDGTRISLPPEPAAVA
jgi:hypothetical protein